MDKPTMFDPYPAGTDVEVFPSYYPIPGFGILPVNAFVLKSQEPVLVDTGLWALSSEFMDKLSSVVNIADLQWLWLTHNDHDHIGSLFRILEVNPAIKVITNYMGLGKISLFRPLPMDRVFLLNPGQSISVGDRKLVSIKPPTYDAPETMGFYDSKASALFSADCFGALMSKPAGSAADIGSRDLRAGLLFWTNFDVPWLHAVDRDQHMEKLNYIRGLSPRIVLSSHLPAAHGMIDELLQCLAAVPEEEPFLGPDQHAFEKMLKGA